jgi:hypothetical protein
MSGEMIILSISLELAVNILGVTYTKVKQMHVFSFINDFIVDSRFSGFLVFRVLK